MKRLITDWDDLVGKKIEGVCIMGGDNKVCILLDDSYCIITAEGWTEYPPTLNLTNDHIHMNNKLELGIIDQVEYDRIVEENCRKKEQEEKERSRKKEEQDRKKYEELKKKFED